MIKLPVRIDPEIERNAKVRATLECLVGAMREPETNPARASYINFMLAKAELVLADTAGEQVRSIAA